MSGIREEFERAYGETENVYYVPWLDVYGCETSEHRESAEAKSAAWYWWQKSRAALKVELPHTKIAAMGAEGHEQYADGWNDYRERVTEALQQAGIEVK